MGLDAENPLLRPGLPAFAAIRPEHAQEAIDRLLAQGRDWVRALDPDAPADAELLLALERIGTAIDDAFSPVRHLRAVCDSPEWRREYEECQRKITEYNTELAHNEDLYRAIKALREGSEWESLEPARQTEVEHMLRDFRLGGVELNKKDKDIFATKEQELVQKAANFSNNVADATQAWSLLLADDGRLEGLLPSERAMLREDARAHGADGYRLSLQPPAVDAVLRHACDRELRAEVFRAYTSRASDQEEPAAPARDNTGVMEDILRLRHEQARLLGFGSIAEYVLVPRMARAPEEVLEFLADLRARARPKAEAEWEELRAYARQECGIEDMERWDVGFVSERLRRARFALSEEELREHFPADAVVQGLLDLAAELFDLDIEQRADVATWHADVRFYEIRDRAGAVRGQFYLDPYARPHKHGGAWMDVCRQRRRDGAGSRPAVAYLVCNGSPPTADAPALLSHTDVVTLFHEFGHGLHHMLSRVDCASLAGTAGIEWDAVEWPSQWMENWCWEPAVLRRFARHHKTGAPMPEALARRLQESRSFLSGIALMRQLEFALFDFRLHAEYTPRRGARIAKLWDEVRAPGGPDVPAFLRPAHAFLHIFAGEYQAGYYSYKWAEVLSADTFDAFREAGLLSREVAGRFERCVLAAGGVRPAREMFEAFRGRAPEAEALLRQDGLAA